MSRITDYGFLFQTTFGTSKTNLVNNIQLSQMNSSSVQKQLKAAGIDTNSVAAQNFCHKFSKSLSKTFRK